MINFRNTRYIKSAVSAEDSLFDMNHIVTIGRSNVGKSTLFNAITHAGAECANYPFCTIEPNVGVVAVPDERLDVLGKLYNTKKSPLLLLNSLILQAL